MAADGMLTLSANNKIITNREAKSLTGTKPLFLRSLKYS